MKKKSENFLDYIPKKNPEIEWKIKEDGMVEVAMQNKGFFNRLAQIIWKRPKVSYISLEEMGSFIWPLMDGKTDITEIGKYVEEKFGEAANPLYERLAKYFQILDSYGFVEWVEK